MKSAFSAAIPPLHQSVVSIIGRALPLAPSHCSLPRIAPQVWTNQKEKERTMNRRKKEDQAIVTPIPSAAAFISCSLSESQEGESGRKASERHDARRRAHADGSVQEAGRSHGVQGERWL